MSALHFILFIFFSTGQNVPNFYVLVIFFLKSSNFSEKTVVLFLQRNHPIVASSIADKTSLLAKFFMKAAGWAPNTEGSIAANSSTEVREAWYGGVLTFGAGGNSDLTSGRHRRPPMAPWMAGWFSMVIPPTASPKLL